MDSLLEKARSYLDRRGGQRVTLEELAAAVGASPFHLQRRFKHAYGVSPRGYQQAKREASVRSELRRGRPVTDALYEAGYGSASRFYEQDAGRLGMAASAYRAGGRGEHIRWCTFRSPVGMVLVAATRRGLCAVRLGDDAASLAAGLAEEFREARLEKDGHALEPFRREILAFLEGAATLARLPLDVRGTVFQRRVWDALRRIPRGETRTYTEIARTIGAPSAVRAVGSACGANPVALVVPCHRALRTDGGLGGYAWGLERKRALLGREGAAGLERASQKAPRPPGRRARNPA